MERTDFFGWGEVNGGDMIMGRSDIMDKKQRGMDGPNWRRWKWQETPKNNGPVLFMNDMNDMKV